MVVKVDEDELIEHWTRVGDELGQVAGKRGATRLGFALLLKFYARHGRFPRGRGELPDEAVAYVARQVGVPSSDLGFYEWDGRTVEYHRAHPAGRRPAPERRGPGIARRIDRQVAQVAAAIRRCGSYPALSAAEPSTPPASLPAVHPSARTPPG
jgi:hypothetical protein